MKQFLVLSAFLTSKGMTEEGFNDVSAEEKAGIFKELNENNAEAINAMRDGSVSKEDLQTAIDENRSAVLKQMETLNEAMKEMGISIKAVTEKGNAPIEKVSTVKEGLSKLLDNGIIKGIKAGTQHGMHLVSKAVGTMLGSTNVSGGNVPVEQRIPGLDTLASRNVRFLDTLAKASATSSIISWVSQANKEGAAGGTAEGASKNQIDFDLVVDSQAVVKRTAYIKVSTEMLDDIDFIESEIRSELMRELLKDIEGTAYNGNGTAPNLNGVYTVATAFAAGAAAATVDNANEIDVINCAIKQIKLAEQSIDSGYIFMNPEDVFKLKSYKVSATDRRYVDMMYIAGDEMRIAGIPVIETTLVTAGEYLLGDMSKATLYNKESVNVLMGLDGNDLTLNLRTIIAEWRGALVVKTNARTCFVKGVFATDKAALETA